MLKISRDKLKKIKILKTDIDINLNTLLPNKAVLINKNKYSFKKIVISIGKNNNFNLTHKSINLMQGIILSLVFLIIKKITIIMPMKFLILMDLWLFYRPPQIIKKNQPLYTLQRTKSLTPR